jgi:hypothetical protein
MRRRTSLSFALILGLIAALGIAPGIVAGQFEVKIDPTSEFTEGIEISQIDNANTEAFKITFLEDASYIPERTTSPNEAMVVKVLAGTLAFRVQTPDVVVDPQGEQLRLIHTQPDNPIPLGTPPESMDPLPQFSANGDVANVCVGDVPTYPYTLCELDPVDFETGDTFVLLEPGHAVFLPSSTTCFFCNVTSIIPPTDQQEQVEPPALLVWASAGAIEAWAQPPDGTESSGPTYVQSQGLHHVRGWMFNPGSPCH